MADVVQTNQNMDCQMLLRVEMERRHVSIVLYKQDIEIERHSAPLTTLRILNAHEVQQKPFSADFGATKALKYLYTVFIYSITDGRVQRSVFSIH